MVEKGGTSHKIKKTSYCRFTLFTLIMLFCATSGCVPVVCSRHLIRGSVHSVVGVSDKDILNMRGFKITVWLGYCEEVVCSALKTNMASLNNGF